MWMRGLSLIVLVFIFGSGFSLDKANAVTPSIEPTHRTVALPSFDHVYVAAPVKLNISPGHDRSQVMLRGDARDLARINADVKEGVLYITWVKTRAHVGQQYQLIQNLH